MQSTLSTSITENSIDDYVELISNTIITFATSLISSGQQINKLLSIIKTLNNIYKSKSNSNSISEEVKKIIEADNKLASKTTQIMKSLNIISISGDFKTWVIHQDKVKELTDIGFDLDFFKNKCSKYLTFYN